MKSETKWFFWFSLVFLAEFSTSEALFYSGLREFSTFSTIAVFDPLENLKTKRFFEKPKFFFAFVRFR